MMRISATRSLGALAIVLGGASEAATAGTTWSVEDQINNAPPNSTVYVEDGIYQVADLFPAKGVAIVCESENTVFRGKSSQSSLFRTNGNAIFRIEGGTWENAGQVVLHEGTSALVSCTFERMRIRNVDEAFNVSSSIGNVWRRCTFEGVEKGVYFPLSGAGQTNVNSLRECKFVDFAETAVQFGPRGQSASSFANSNTVANCWFVGTGQSKSAIYLSNVVKSLTITGCYFESTGGAGHPDIMLDPQGGTIANVVIEGNLFNRDSKGQDYRLKNVGISGYRAENNHARLLHSKAFAGVGGSKVQSVRLDRNSLDTSAVGDYADSLYESLGGQDVSYTVLKGASPSHQVPAMELRTGRNIQKVYSLGSGGTPSVEDGDLFMVGKGSDVVDLSDGKTGQTVRLIASGNRKVVAGNALLLAGNFSMQLGDTLTLTRVDVSGTPRWVEVARSVNN